MEIRKVAVFHCMTSLVSSWSAAGGIVRTLDSMGYNVLNCGRPEEIDVPLEQLQDVDLIILSGPEWYWRKIDERYGIAWTQLEAKKAAWYQESFNRDDGQLSYAPMAHIADRHYFPAAQDAEAYGGCWLPFGVDTALFTPQPVRKICDAAFLGQIYPKRAQYVQRINYPIFHLRTEFDPKEVVKSVQRLAEGYSSTRIVINLPSYSRLLVGRVTEALACRTMLVTPRIDHQSAQRNTQVFRDRVHLAYYDPDRPQEIGEIIEYYLDHGDEREEIADAGWRFVNERHTIQHRLQTMIDDLRGERGGALDLRPERQRGTLPDGYFRVVSHHSTMLYIDFQAAQVRHTAQEAALPNLVPQVDGDRGRLMTAGGANTNQQISIHRANARIAVHESGAEFDFLIETLPNGSVALRSGELYVSADKDGVVRCDRKICREWEHYQLVPMSKDITPKHSSGGPPIEYGVNVIRGGTTRSLSFDMQRGNAPPRASDPVCRSIAMRILSEAAVGSIIDAGAGSGRFAIPIARRFRHDLVVLSFERQRMVFYELCGNIAANSCGNIFPHNVELGDSVDPDVRRTTLDSFEIVDARLIKFDVEGAEVSLLRGAHATIAASDYPPLLFSCWSDGALSARAGAREELLAEVSGLGYRLTSFGPVAFAQHCGKKPIEFTLLI